MHGGVRREVRTVQRCWFAADKQADVELGIDLTSPAREEHNFVNPGLPEARSGYLGLANRHIACRWRLIGQAAGGKISFYQSSSRRFNSKRPILVMLVRNLAIRTVNRHSEIPSLVHP